MKETLKNTNEVLQPNDEAELFERIISCEPKLITKFVPQDAKEQKAQFLAGNIDNPRHEYNLLNELDIDEMSYKLQQCQQLVEDGAIDNQHHREIYRQMIDDYQDKLRLMRLARSYNNSPEGPDKDDLRDEFMALNIELYAAPDEPTYRDLLAERVKKLEDAQFSPEAAVLRDELFDLLDKEKLDNNEEVKRFVPHEETVEWMHEIAMYMYGPLLDRVPQQDSFEPEEAAVVFQDIINSEFGESASGWRVDVEEHAKAINVKATEKRIVIPKNRTGISYDAMRSLVVHEIGVHMMRAIMGEETDTMTLQVGLVNYYDFEEGLGVVMEQALFEKYSDRGVDHYLTAGLAFHDGKDFRQVYDVKWRLNILEQLAGSEQAPTFENIESAKKNSYSQVMRIFRGTDELPWFKDLAYYRGHSKTWQYIEENRGDYEQFKYLFAGKADPQNNKHRRIIYESKSIVQGQ